MSNEYCSIGDNMENLISDQTIKNALKKYCNEVNKYYKAGNIESSFNKPVIDLIQSFGCSAHDFSGERSGITGENIDIKLWHADEDINTIPPFGAIEVKKVNGKDERAKKQIIIETKKYGNVILTDNATWEFYNSESEKMYNGFRLLKVGNNELELDESKVDLFITTIKDFILEKPNNIKSSSRLAYYMSEYAKTIKTIVFNILQANGTKAMYNELSGLYSRIKEELLPDLEYRDFSDMYAQTIVYGLFIARYNDKTVENFTRGEAIENLSKESHLLKQFFQHIATSDNLHPTLNDSIDKLCELYALTDIKELLNQYEKKDAIVHFYEDFLTFYDLKQKKSFGAYYTPVSIVRYIVQMVDEVLINDFNIKNGLSNNDTTTIKVKSDPYTIGTGKKAKTLTEKEIDVPQVAILDPACGTGTFGAEIIKFIKNKYFSNGNELFYKEWLQNENGLMQRLISFEIMMTSYVIAHLKIRRTLMETIGEQQINKRLPSNIFLTNTLAEPKSIIERNSQISFFDFSGAITEEAENADQWKCRRPIQVIIGNPPYNRKSNTPFDISIYRTEIDGVTPFKEKKDCLSDDYVKFIRFAEQHIQKDGKGILAFITNNAYLDNPTARGMRASLLRTFDKINIVNLHGNSKKRETSPNGDKDENVFDIQQGVSIFIGVKTTNNDNWANVYYSEIYGTRQHKFDVLDEKDLSFIEVELDPTNVIFIPQQTSGKEEYNKGISISKLFKLNVTGLMSGNDKVSICSTKTELINKLNIVKYANSDGDILNLFGKLTAGQDISKIRSDVLEKNGIISQIAYRPFDNRWTYYSGESCGWIFRPRDKKIMGQLLNDNLIDNKNIGFVFSKGANKIWDGVFVANSIIDAHLIDYPGRSYAYIAPLYIKSEQAMDDWIPNFDIEELEKLTINLIQKPKPLEVFDYCYGILNSLKYRSKYNELLKLDYPKVPVIENQEIFETYRNAGEKLRKLHLMETDVQKELSIETESNNLIIEQAKYNNGKIQINKNTMITGLTDEIWDFSIGGYQVIDKWLKLHKGESITIDSFTHIKRIAGIIEETIEIQEEY